MATEMTMTLRVVRVPSGQYLTAGQTYTVTPGRRTYDFRRADGAGTYVPAYVVRSALRSGDFVAA